MARAKSGVVPSIAMAATIMALVLGLFAVPAFAANPGGWVSPAPGGEDAVVLGEKEPVELGTPNGDARVEVLAKVDTGATYSSMDYDLARELGIELDEQPIITVQSSLGEDERRLVDVRLTVAGRDYRSKVTVADRDEFENKMLLGNRDLDGFLVDTSREQLTTPEAPTVASPVAALLEFPPPPPSAPMLLAALPLAAVLIVALRTLVGLNTFGLFAPVLLALALVQVGIPVGLTIFGTMIAAGILVQPLLSVLRLPRVSRLAVLLATSAVTLLAVNGLVDNPAVNASWATAFPVVVTATIIERFWDVWEQESIGTALTTAAWTLLAAAIACPLLVASPVSWAAEEHPLALGLVGAALSVFIGLYRGLRLTELVRFRGVGFVEESRENA